MTRTATCNMEAGRSGETCDAVGVFARPTEARLVLHTAPVLESWNAANHPDQVRLAMYLDEVEGLLALKEPASHLALDLQVGVPEPRPVTSGGGDLDNYLYPVVRRLGAWRFDAAFASKYRASTSTVAVGGAVAIPYGRVPDMQVTTTASADTPAWKEQVRDVCAAVMPEPLMPGPLALDVEFRLSARRNWAKLWKPAIDSLGPLLGVANPSQPFRPDDDRIVQLSLHRLLDESLGWNIHLSVWWSAQPRRVAERGHSPSPRFT